MAGDLKALYLFQIRTPENARHAGSFSERVPVFSTECDLGRLHHHHGGSLGAYSARSIRMMSSSGIRRVANHMVIAAAAHKETARAMDIAKSTGLASGITLPREFPTALAPTTPRTAPIAITSRFCVKSIPLTRAGVAPRAIRKPISWVRSATE